MHRCLIVFFRFASDHGVELDRFEHEPSYASAIAALFIQHCFEVDVPFWVAKYGLLGLQSTWRHLRGRLGRGWDALRGWALRRPQRSRLPLPLDVLRAMVGLSFTLGLRQHRTANAYLTMSVLLRLGFYGLLRPKEIVELKAGDVHLPRQYAADGALVIAIRDPKNRLAMGKNQFALVKDPSCIAWMRWLLKGVPKSCKLWPGSQCRFSKMFKSLLIHLELSHYAFTPGSLRPGGTTHEFMRGTAVSQLKFMGRWASETSLVCYVQETMAHRVWNSVSPAEAQLLDAWISVTLHIWESPPSAPWTSWFDRRRQQLMLLRRRSWKRF